MFGFNQCDDFLFSDYVQSKKLIVNFSPVNVYFNCPQKGSPTLKILKIDFLN